MLTNASTSLVTPGGVKYTPAQADSTSIIGQEPKGTTSTEVQTISTTQQPIPPLRYTHFRTFKLAAGSPHRKFRLLGYVETKDLDITPEFVLYFHLFRPDEKMVLHVPSLEDISDYLLAFLQQEGKEPSSLVLYRWETCRTDVRTGRTWTDGYKVRHILDTNRALDHAFLEYSTLSPESPELEILFKFTLPAASQLAANRPTKRGLELKRILIRSILRSKRARSHRIAVVFESLPVAVVFKGLLMKHDYVAGVLTRIPKMGLEEATEGVSNTGLDRA